MADTLAVKDEGTAREWLAKAEALNQRAHELNNRVGSLLQQISEDSEGELVTKLVEWGNKCLVFAQDILEGCKQIASGISSVINTVKDAVSNVVGFIGKVMGLG